MPVFAQRPADEEPRVPLQLAHRAQPDRSRSAWHKATRRARRTRTTPHAKSDDGGVGLAPHSCSVNFLDNHDLPRFLFEKADPHVLRAALVYLFTWDGIPCIYYGTEQLFDGGVDPKNREDMFRGNPKQGFAPFATDHETFQLVKGLIAMRKAHPALQRGTVAPVWSTTLPGPRRDAGIFAFERGRARRDRARRAQRQRAAERDLRGARRWRRVRAHHAARGRDADRRDARVGRPDLHRQGRRHDRGHGARTVGTRAGPEVGFTGRAAAQRNHHGRSVATKHGC